MVYLTDKNRADTEMADRPTLLAEAICAAMRDADPEGYVGPADDPTAIIDGHFDMMAVSRAVLATFELPVHLIEKVKDCVPR